MLLAYCAARMSSIDGNISTAMSTQETSVKQQQALQTFASAMKQFAPKGPQNDAEWQKVKDAYATLQSTLGPDDPACKQCKGVIDDLDKSFHPPPMFSTNPKVVEAQNDLQNAKNNARSFELALAQNPGNVAATQGKMQAEAAIKAAEKQLAIVSAFPEKGPFTPVGDGQWAAKACDQVDSTLTNLKGSSEMQMIKLQSMVSQRQTVIQLVTGMMSKLDQAAETAARAIGGG